MNENILKLEKIAKDRFDYALVCDPGSEESKKALEEVRQAQELGEKMKEKEPPKKWVKIFNIVMEFLKLFGVPAALMTLDYLYKRAHTTRVCNFEKDYNFTTTPGKATSSLFRWK